MNFLSQNEKDEAIKVAQKEVEKCEASLTELKDALVEVEGADLEA